jgi:muramoyltetrapeptide carboxypeptidase
LSGREESRFVFRMDFLKPPRLNRGDLIGLVSPASTPAPREKIESSVRYLERLGYRAKVGANAEREHGYLAGTDEQRAADLNNFIRDPRVKALFALRGGYGTPRILSLIDYRALRRSPKIISGFSDITALQLAILRRCGLVTFSGPMPAVEFWKDPDPYTEENFWRLLTSKKKLGPLAASELEVLNEGRASGALLGGNLSLVVNCLGTRFLPSMRGAILVLEEVDEAPYRVDRMLTQLMNSGIASRLAGLVFGQFTRCEQKDPAKPSLTCAEVLRDFASRLKCPVLTNLQYGHVPRKLTIPFGLSAQIDAARKRISVLESAVV